MSSGFKKFKFTVRNVSEKGVTTFTLPLTTSTRGDSPTSQQCHSHQNVEVVHQHDPPIQQESTKDQQLSNVSMGDNVNQWTDVREQLLQVFFDIHLTACAACSLQIKETEHIRCKDCGQQTYYCSVECCKVYHTWDINPFHKPMHWKDNVYTDLYMDIALYRQSHACVNKYIRHGIQVYDQLGRVHIVGIETCGCEDAAVSFLRHGLWSSSVKQPHVAFHVELLNTIEYAMLEGKMSLYAFCQTLRWRNKMTIKECETLYTRLRGEPMEQFRHLKFLSRSFKFLSTGEENDREIWNCLACPEENGDLFVCLDANFGLVRKKGKSSVSHQPNHKDGMFIPTVNKNTSEMETASQPCNNFQAGNILRSKSRNNKLAVTGVFGSACRHGVPITFLDMEHGERLCLSETLISHLLQKTEGQGLNIHIIYDIACVLHTHLKAKQDERYSQLSFAVPSFHAYGHKASCQVKYSTRWQQGYGITDGEDMERLWAFLRRFSFITKEMSPSHRIDLLTDALLHFRDKKLEVMDYSLAHNIERANAVVASVSNELSKYMETSQLSMEMVDNLVEMERERMACASSTDVGLSEEESYVELLLKQSELENDCKMCVSVEKEGLLEERLTRVNGDLKKLERKMGIRKRWPKAGKLFKLHHQQLQQKKKIRLISKLHQCALELEFMHGLKGKYGERNQKIAARLQKQILKTAKSAKRTVQLYNNAGFEVDGMPDKLQYEDIIKCNSDIYQHLQITNQNIMIGAVSLPESVCLKVAELRNRQQRAEEEKTMTKHDMLSMLTNLEIWHSSIVRKLGDGEHNAGLQIALNEKSEHVRKRYHRARAIFAKFFTLPPVPDEMCVPNISNIIFELVDQDTSFLPSSDSEESSSEAEM